MGFKPFNRGVCMRRKQTSAPARAAYLFLTPYFVFYSLFGLFPILFSLTISFTDWNGMGSMNFVGLDNYIRLFTQDTFFIKSLGNTAFFMICYIPVVLVGGLLLAAVLNSKLLPVPNLFRLVNFFPYITIPVAIGLIFALMFDWSSGVVNNLLISLGILDQGINWMGDAHYARYVAIMMLIWKQMGYHMMMYSAGLSTVPSDLYDAAAIDGAGAVKTFWHISVPHVRSVTLFLMVTDIIHGFQLFDEVKLLFAGWGAGTTRIGGPSRCALTTTWYMYDTAFHTKMEYGYSAAISYSLFLVILIFSIVSFRINRANSGIE